MSPESTRFFSCIRAASCSRSMTRNLPLFTSSVTNTSWAAAAPLWYHHWFSALLLNSSTAMRGLSLAAAKAVVEVSASNTPASNVVVRRFILGSPPLLSRFPGFGVRRSFYPAPARSGPCPRSPFACTRGRVGGRALVLRTGSLLGAVLVTHRGELLLEVRLELQVPRSADRAHEERLVGALQQVCDHEVKQVLHELE